MMTSGARLRIAVTGKDGQVVSALRERANVLGVDIIALGRPKLDLQNPSSILPALAAAKPNVIVNAASFTAVDQAENDASLAHQVNATGAGEVAKAANTLAVPIVHLSTDYVFDGAKGEPYWEWDHPNPQSVYARSKLAGEYVTQSILHRFYVVRTAWLYGRGAKNFVTSVLRLASERDQLHYVTDEVGSPTYAPDLAQALSRLILRPIYGIYHLTNTGVCSRYEWAKAILEMAGRPDYPIVPTQGYQRAAKVPARNELRNLAAATQFGITMRPWREALADYFDGD
jgi:dTDP-4-dehydrorhamnose reductase